jgi:hypothetical protein
LPHGRQREAVPHSGPSRGEHAGGPYRAIDVIRIVSLVGVVLGHTIMATSTLRDGVFIWSNLLTVSPVFQALIRSCRCSSSPASQPPSGRGVQASAGAIG